MIRPRNPQCIVPLHPFITNQDILQGADIEQSSRRIYPDSEYFSSIIGYIGKASQDELDSLQAENSQKGAAGGSSDGTLEVHYIDVGQGDATLIRQGSHAMLIDGGNNDIKGRGGKQ